MTTPPEQPSEAMIGAGVHSLTTIAPDTSDDEMVTTIYLAMQRAATPAPVQDDDAKLVKLALGTAAELRAQGHGSREQYWLNGGAEILEKLANRLATDTALVEALKNIRERIIGGLEVGEPQLQMIDKALASRGGDNGK